MKVLVEYIINQLLDNQQGKVWIGPTYDKHLSRINEENAFIRPLPEMHSVAEIISHLTTWQKETTLKIETGEGSITDDAEQNWYPNEKLEAMGWTSVLHEYKSSLFQLIDLLKTKEDAFLDEQYYDTDFKGHYPYSFVVNGMLQHNLYHLGQVGLIVKYLKQIGKY